MEAQKTIQRQESQLNFVRESHKQTVSLLGKQSQEFLAKVEEISTQLVIWAKKSRRSLIEH